MGTYAKWFAAFIFHTFLGFSLIGQTDSISRVEDVFALSLEELLDVKVVSASKKEEKISAIPASVEVITREDIEDYGYTSLEEIIANVTGYYVMEDLSYRFSQPGVRGFMSMNGTGAIILINGVSQVRKGYESYSIRESSVPVECIDRVEIIRGPMSVLYGTGAFYGVINIITDKAYEQRFKGQVAVSAGSLETRKICLALSGETDSLEYSVNAGYRYTYGPNFSLLRMTADTTKFEVITAPKDTDGRLEGSDKYFDMSLKFKPFYCRFTYLELMQESYGVLASWDDGNLIENSKVNLMVGFDQKLGNKLNMNASFRYNRFNNYMDIPWLKEDYYAHEDVRSDGYEAELRFNYQPTKSIGLIAGYNRHTMLNYMQIWDYVNFGGVYNNHERELDRDNHINSNAFFAQVDYAPYEKLQLIAGFRLEKTADYDYTQSFGSDTTGTTGPAMRTKFRGTYKDEGLAFIPRLAVLYHFSSKSHLKFFYGEGLKHPTLEENINNIKDIDQFGYLQNERIKTYELNFTTTVSSVLNLQTSLFYNELDNLISRVWVQEPNGDYVSHQENAGTYVTSGAELTLLYSPFEHVRLSLRGSYQQSKDLRDGFEDVAVAYSPIFLGYASVLYKLKKFSFSLTGNYVDEMETFWSGQAPGSDEPGARIGDKAKAYFILNGNARANDLFGTGLYASFKVSNIFDKTYQIPATTVKLWAERGNPGMERMFLFGVGYKF